MSDPDKYEVLEKIGHGSFGVIHKVRRKADGLILCRKEISYSKMTPKEREQLQAELSILKELKHPNIVQYFERDHLKSTQDLHLYMEYCGNGDLGQVIKRLKQKNQYAEEEFVWSIFAQTITALYRCHYGEDPPDVGRNVMGLGPDAKPLKSKQSPYMILHRDLKPENVFLDSNNAVKLGDFGLSKILQSHDFASTYVGTPFYMSPEICAAERYSLYSDIWSLGCLIYELCTKEPPFNARTHIELFHKIKAGRVAPLPPVYSAELQKVVTSCLQVNAHNRPDTAQLLNLPVVKLMRKENEVVRLGRQLKFDRDIMDRKLRDAEDRLKKMDTDREAMRVEIDAAVRREWEVRARLEIDRQVEVEVERLRSMFEAEVEKHAAHRAEQILRAHAEAVPSARSSTPEPLDDRPSRVGASQSTLDTDSDFASGTDLSSLSISDSPFHSKHSSKMLPLKRSRGTPFTRAHTTNYAPSPLDAPMADPSPMSIASLALSPRKDASTTQGSQRPKPNLFTAAEDRWRPHSLSTSASASDSDETRVHEDENDEEDVLPLPSPSRDPFKPTSKRPSLTRQKTAPANSKRLASAPTLFGRNVLSSTSNPTVRRPTSAVPVVGTSPARTRAPQSPRPKTTIPPLPTAKNVSDSGSPLKRVSTKDFATVTVPNPGNRAKAGSGGATNGDGMLKTAMRNQIQGRTLVELAQARAGGVVDRERSDDGVAHSGLSMGMKGVRVSEKEVPVWDPEREEMPSPFLVRGVRGIRAGLR